MTIKAINEVAVRTYGVGVLDLDATAALWLAENILFTTGRNVYRRVSSHRNKFGKGTSFPLYGTELFRGM